MRSWRYSTVRTLTVEAMYAYHQVYVFLGIVARPEIGQFRSQVGKVTKSRDIVHNYVSCVHGLLDIGCNNHKLAISKTDEKLF